MLTERQIKYLKDNSLKIHLDIDHCNGHCYIDIYRPEYSVYSSYPEIDEIEGEIQSMIDFLIDQDEGDVDDESDTMSEDEEHYLELDEYFTFQGGDIDSETVK